MWVILMDHWICLSETDTSSAKIDKIIILVKLLVTRPVASKAVPIEAVAIAPINEANYR